MPADISMYCLKKYTLHSFSFCCDYVSLKVIRVSLSWQHKCSLTFDRNILDLSWMCCDAHAVCSFWVITHNQNSFFSVEIFLGSTLTHLLCLLPSKFLFHLSLPSFLPFHCCLSHLHTLLSSHFPPSAACGAYFRGKSSSPLEIHYSVCRIINQATQKSDSSLNLPSCKWLTESNAVYQHAATNTKLRLKHRLEELHES